MVRLSFKLVYEKHIYIIGLQHSMGLKVCIVVMAEFKVSIMMLLLKKFIDCFTIQWPLEKEFKIIMKEESVESITTVQEVVDLIELCLL